MKPQREGGGNNIYREEILKALKEMEKRDEGKGKVEVKEREGYILMSLIKPPKGVGNYLVKAPTKVGGDEEEIKGPALMEDVVSELGIYGTSLFKKGRDGIEIVDMEAGGYLLRTKGRSSDEGGVGEFW